MGPPGECRIAGTYFREELNPKSGAMAGLAEEPQKSEDQ